MTKYMEKSQTNDQNTWKNVSQMTKYMEKSQTNDQIHGEKSDK